MLDLALRLFAHLISVDEDDLGYITQFFEDARVIRNWFCNYDVDNDKWKATVASLTYSAIKEYYEDFGDAPSLSSVEDIIENRDVRDSIKASAISWLKDIDDVEISKAEFTFLLTELQKNYLRTKAAEVTNHLLLEIEQDPAQAFKNMVEEVNDIQMETQSRTKLSGVQSAATIAKQFLAEAKGEIEINSYLPFPFKSFNRELTGMGMGELTAFLGMFSSGKSTLMKECAFHAIEHSNDDEIVFLFDNEMDKKQIFPRLASRLCGIPINKIRDGKTSKSEFKLYKDALREVMNSDCYERLLFVSKTEFHTVKDIKRHMVAQSKGRKVIGMYVDHIGKLRYSQSSILDHQNVKDCLSLIRDYAQEYDCAGGVVGHLNRDNEVQFHSVLDLCDLGFVMRKSEARQGVTPNVSEGDYLGKPTQIDVEVVRGRTHVSGQLLYLDALFSTSTIVQTPKDRIAHRSNKLRALAKKTRRSG